MKYLGIILIIIAVMLFFFSLYKKREERLLLEREISRLLLHIKREISCFSRPLADAISSFESETLSKMGFFEISGKSGSIRERVYLFFKSSSVSEDALSIIEGYFMSECGYLESENARISETSERFCKYLTDREARCEREKKLFSLLSFAVSFGVVIIVL